MMLDYGVEWRFGGATGAIHGNGRMICWYRDGARPSSGGMGRGILCVSSGKRIRGGPRPRHNSRCGTVPSKQRTGQSRLMPCRALMPGRPRRPGIRPAPPREPGSGTFPGGRPGCQALRPPLSEREPAWRPRATRAQACGAHTPSSGETRPSSSLLPGPRQAWRSEPRHTRYAPIPPGGEFSSSPSLLPVRFPGKTMRWRRAPSAPPSTPATSHSPRSSRKT